MSEHEEAPPRPGRLITEGKLAAVLRTAEAGYSNAADVIQMVAEIRYLRAELDLLQSIDPALPPGSVLVLAADLQRLLPRAEHQITLTPVEQSAVLRLRAAADGGKPAFRPPEAEHCNCPAAAVWGATGNMPPGHHWHTTATGGYLAHDPGWHFAESQAGS